MGGVGGDGGSCKVVPVVLAVISVSSRDDGCFIGGRRGSGEDDDGVAVEFITTFMMLVGVVDCVFDFCFVCVCVCVCVCFVCLCVCVCVLVLVVK